MFQKLLKKHYGIDAIETAPVSHYPSCQKDNTQYILISINNFNEEDLQELQQMAEHLQKSGDQYVCTFQPTKDNEALLKLDQDQYCVLASPLHRSPSVGKIGRKLAKFHYRGRLISFSVQRTSRIGQWKQLWEQRVDQMEKVWNTMLFQEPESEFDRLFLESFPYYMSIAENAIQYLVDTELDDNPTDIDSGTICHARFNQFTWGQDQWLRIPFDWVFDHCSRDLAEWTRDTYHQHFKTYQPEMKQFFKDYQSVEPLSPFAWRLLYARLLFPLHYFECIEDYYSIGAEQYQRAKTDQLEKYLQYSNDHERFLRDFFQLTEVPQRKYQIPALDWL